MTRILVTGINGFIGKYLSTKYIDKFIYTRYDFHSEYVIEEKAIIHLAGLAHDLINANDPQAYYQVNTDLTKIIFEKFLISNSEIFIFVSSVKAVADKLDVILTEGSIPNPLSYYGKSKLLAEEYILSKTIPFGKRVYILRPCMIHGPGNKGNLNILYKIVSKGIPWPLGAFDNKRSFCSIDNLCFVFKELIENNYVPSGVYNIADDDPLSTNELIKLISDSKGKISLIWNIPKFFIKLISLSGNLLKFPLNTERLNKLTETYVVSNNKIKQAINKPLPVSAIDGLKKTFNSFNQ